HQVVHLPIRDRGDVADLPEPVAARIDLEHLDGLLDQLRDGGRAVVVPNDPAGYARCAGPDSALLDHEHVGAALRQPPRGEDDVARSPQLHGYGLLETGWRSPVSKRSKRKG